MKPGTLVSFKLNTITMTGRIVTNGGNMATVEANGNTYEVSASQLQIIRTCQRCGKPVANQSRNKFCSKRCSELNQITNLCKGCGKHLGHNSGQCRNCRFAALKKDTDDRIFAAIVEYKQAHDGSTPDRRWLTKRTFCVRLTVNRSIQRLVAAGRLRLENRSVNQDIIVIGGKWTYEEPTP